MQRHDQYRLLRTFSTRNTADVGVVPRVLPDWDWGSVLPEIAKLEVVSSKMEQVCRSTLERQLCFEHA
jgi:hypothetical protein